MEQAAKPGTLSSADASKLLWDRWLHIERLLVATLFAMFITTTVGIFAAASKVQAGGEANPARDSLLLLGAAAAYAVLSGYYYFMLAQNYAAMVGLLRINRDMVQVMSALWDFFKPKGARIGSVAHQAMLLPAAAVPLIITCLSLLGLKLMLDNEIAGWFWASVVGHIALFFAMIWSPFRQFIRILHDLTAQLPPPESGAPALIDTNGRGADDTSPR